MLKVIVRILTVTMKHDYIGEFEIMMTTGLDNCELHRQAKQVWSDQPQIRRAIQRS